MSQKPKFVFFGSSRFSHYVLDELEKAGYSPVLNITSAREDLPMEKLRELNADLFIVASFGKILPKELIEMPRLKTLNVHPSLLPELRGPAPIQGLILGKGAPGVTLMRMDEKMDHGPILAQEKVSLEPWPDHYAVVEEKLGRAGGKLLVSVLPQWVTGEISETVQDDARATFIKLVKKEDGLLDLHGDPDTNLRKVLAYSTWPGAYFMHTKKNGELLRVVVKEARVIDGVFSPLKVVPAGKREMDWQSFENGFLRANA